MGQLHLKNIPEELWQQVENETYSYSLAILGMKTPDRKEAPRLKGSGTLVQLDGQEFILTAQHVIALLGKCCRFAFVLDEEAHSRTHASRVFVFHEIGIPTCPEMGPDIGLIRIPDNLRGYLHQKKSFYNLANKEDLLDHAALLARSDLWVISGAVDELTVLDVSRNEYSIGHQCYGAGMPAFSEESGYDYFELTAQYNTDTVTPTSFGGVSGGGLWRLRIGEGPGGYTIADHAKLVGVCYYQGPTEQDATFVRGHGPKTVYGIVCKYIRDGKI